LSRRGIGKVVAHAPGEVTVEFFYSIVRRRCEVVAPDAVNSLARLAAQTRCYVVDERGQWRMGRVGRKVEGEYEVLFRQGEARFVRERDVHVRCLAPLADPTEVLIYKGQETPFFHDRRFRFAKSLLQERAACRGMTGLLSSRIELLPHQVEVVRRVLEDPVQRYLLADEVGLGKTIEAGVVLRQFLLDDPSGRAAVVVPPLLVDQWAEELEDKFQVSRLGADRVVIAAVGDISELLSTNWGLVVLDEAQHVAALAGSVNAAARREYAAYEQLAASTERLLLLSATPVLHNEQDFLAMLHLLDPRVYSLSDAEGFRDRVHKRQEVGHLLLSVQEGSPGFVLRSSVKRLREQFPDDAPLGKLGDALELALAANPVNPLERDAAIRSIRVHVSETYRLHRRMLRNRRGTVQVEALHGRHAGTATPRTLEYDLDERSPKVHELLEEWRDTAVAALARDGGETPGLTEEALARVFAALFDAGGTWLEVLRGVVGARLDPGQVTPMVKETAGENLASLRDTPLFAGERHVLEGILELLRTPSEEGDRVELLATALDYARRAAKGGPPKWVVFTTHTTVCRAILDELRSRLGSAAVSGYHEGLSRTEVEASIGRFRTHAACFVLVCDRAGEEGRNLQFAERVAHFDLPLAPNRLEQRIGRLDRIGRDRPVRSTIFVGPECEHSLHEAWYRVLDEGFRVFDTSIASLQFFVESKMPELRAALFREGATGLRDAIPAILAGIAEEQERLNEQDALDTIDAFEQNAVASFEAIRELEATHATLEADMHGWVGEALRFDRDPDFYQTEKTVLYRPQFDRFRELRTLVPADWLQHRLTRHLEHPGAFDRKVALKVKGTPVFRIGEGLVDAMERYLRWDDRGQAFALWRQEPGWDVTEGAEWTGFRFDYVVTAELRAARQVLTEHGLPTSALRSLIRLADALFPPIVEVVYLDTDGRPVTDQKLLSVLCRPYRSSDKGGTDFNLAHERLPALDDLVPPERWPELCQAARDRSAVEAMSRGTPPLHERCAELAVRAERELGARLAQLRLRVDREPEHGRAAVVNELSAEEALSHALVAGIREPNLRLDAIGFIAISGRPPGQGGAV
jgi:ATP-dependent helicase HepA